MFWCVFFLIMVYDISIDIGTCVTRNKSYLTRIYCLDSSGENYCCHLTNSSNLIRDSGHRACCSLDRYSDQQWVTLASIQGFSILLGVIFAYLVIVVGYFYVSSYGLREGDIRDTRRKILRHLLKKQMLHKPKRMGGGSAVAHLLHIGHTLSSSRSDKRKRQLRLQRKLKEADDRRARKRGHDDKQPSQVRKSPSGEVPKDHDRQLRATKSPHGSANGVSKLESRKNGSTGSSAKSPRSPLELKGSKVSHLPRSARPRKPFRGILRNLALKTNKTGASKSPSVGSQYASDKSKESNHKSAL